MKSLILAISLLFVSSCAELLVKPELSTKIYYQRDIKFQVQTVTPQNTWGDAVMYDGVGVVPESSAYRITVFPTGKADMITVSSCHREEKTADPEKHSWFKKGYPFIIQPMKDLETDRACPFDIGIYEKAHGGRHAWGMAVPDSKKYKLPAMARCNGVTKQYKGVSVCQAKKGLIQEYIFDRKVDYATTVGCEIMTPKEGNRWSFLMPPGPCTLYFIDYNNPDLVHQANFHGYDSIPIRGAQ